ncbi:cellulose biosynthesis cyclic di-GMP-binding regulatory protein BcsB [uncultured Enterococcus sp.]|uniref:cellulose biosynthesis cyclic di-GMP-binding regulatory protein BcsB n=1 Tax=uncultured Enterococcus sp. TaxID=167972 RepID=UPI002AA68780|nr:cellulose biosynthesis cyclic di-GMP-binding regulatory protein BcsB [uncultured Enterococcus sp.]
MKKLLVFLAACLVVSIPSAAQAETEEQSNHSFTQPFQNVTGSLTGTSVKATMYFTRIDYWDVKKATFNLKYQITQLENDEASDITVAVNGVKFYSWRPDKTTEIQNETIDIPLDLVSSSNTLTVEGQIINAEGTDSYKLVQTPANWLTIYDGSNVNFQYDLMLPENTIHSFYNHFAGADTIANQQSTIVVPTDASAAELSAASYALTGVSRIITASENYLPLQSLSDEAALAKPYVLIISRYDELPEKYKSQIDEKEIKGKALLKFFNTEQQHVMVATSNDETQLMNAGRYIANQELMTQTEKAEKVIDENTKTFASSLEFDGNISLTSSGDKLTGSYHQEQVYFVDLPVDRNNADGSSLDIHMKYSDNLNFDNSLVTVYVNDLPIGSQKLSRNKANGDQLQLDFPKGLEISDAFVIKVAFDLNVDNPEILRNSDTPWALIENDSNVFIQTEESDEVLFSNYPNVFIQNQTYADLGVVLPEKLNADYFKALTNVLNLLGNYTQSNTGDITYYQSEPSKKELVSHNLIILGTPKDNPLIKKMNKDLYFQYSDSFDTFISNEKLSIESDYGKSIGTAQLLFSPYNKEAVSLVLTGVNSETVYLASTQLKSQANTSIYQGDAVVVDGNYRRYDYRFKKEASAEEEDSVISRIISQKDALIYSIVFILAVVTVALVLYYIIKRYYPNIGGKGEDRDE